MTAMRRMLAAAALAVACLAGVPAGAGAATQSVDLQASVKLLNGSSGATLRQRGSVSGAPIGSGTITLDTNLGQGRGARFRFTISTSRGVLRGTGDIGFTFSGLTVTYRGTARITGGTGSWRNARANRLSVFGRGPATGESFNVRLSGRMSS